MFAYAGGCNAYKYQTCHACPRSGRIEWIHNGYDRRVTVFPITLSPCIRIRKLPAVRYYHTRGQIEILVCRAPLGSMSTPRRAFSIFVRFIVLDGAHTHTHTHTARYELVVRQSIAYVPCSPNFRRCCRNETGPECIRLRLKYLPICSEPFGRFPFPRAGPMAAEARTFCRTFHGKLVEASDRFRI